MTGTKRRIHRYHIDVTTALLFELVFCAVALVFTYAKGCDVLFYAGFPMLTAALQGAASFFGIDGFVEEQTLQRLQRGRTKDAIHVLQSSLTVCLIWGLILFLLLYVFAGNWCKSLFGFAGIASVYRAFAPAVALLAPMGCMSGFLRGIGERRLARMGMWMVTMLFTVLSLVCGFYWSYRGVKVGDLLQNEDMTSIYCGCGIAMGLNIAVILTLLCLMVLCRVHAGRLRPVRTSLRYVPGGQEELESGAQLRKYCVQRLVPAGFLALVPFLGIVVGYQFWVGGQSVNAILTSVWGGFMGVGLPLLSGCAIVSALPLTAMTSRLLRDRSVGKERALKTRIAMILRLGAYISIPWSVFCFGAAKEIVALLPNLTVRGRLSAIMTVKYGCVLIFLLQTAILMGYFFWNCRQQRSLILSSAIGFFAQMIALVIMSEVGLGIVMIILSVDIYFIVFLAALYIFGQQDLIRGLSAAWMIDDGLITVCALIAVIPIELLNDYLIEALPGIAAFLVAAAIYMVIYLLCSILLKAADLRNVEKLPGGGIVVSLAYMIGAVHTEDDEDE